MKGVVRPQQAPTARKLRTHRQIGGEAGATATGPSGSIVEVDVAVYQADRGTCRFLVGLLLHVVPCSSAGDRVRAFVEWREGEVGAGNDHDDLQWVLSLARLRHLLSISF